MPFPKALYYSPLYQLFRREPKNNFSIENIRKVKLGYLERFIGFIIIN